ncbi:hypothetical protein D3C85_1841870 [compost metagenome]
MTLAYALTLVVPTVVDRLVKEPAKAVEQPVAPSTEDVIEDNEHPSLSEQPEQV